VALKDNAEVVFRGYSVQSDGSVLLQFTCEQPGPNQPGEYRVTLSAEELSTVRNQTELIALVTSKLRVAFRPTIAGPIRTTLDAAVGRAFTV
jgi:hypothetical protein